MTKPPIRQLHQKIRQNQVQLRLAQIKLKALRRARDGGLKVIADKKTGTSERIRRSIEIHGINDQILGTRETVRTRLVGNKGLRGELREQGGEVRSEERRLKSKRYFNRVAGRSMQKSGIAFPPGYSVRNRVAGINRVILRQLGVEESTIKSWSERKQVLETRKRMRALNLAERRKLVNKIRTSDPAVELALNRLFG